MLYVSLYKSIYLQIFGSFPNITFNFWERNRLQKHLIKEQSEVIDSTESFILIWMALTLRGLNGTLKLCVLDLEFRWISAKPCTHKQTHELQLRLSMLHVRISDLQFINCVLCQITNKVNQVCFDKTINFDDLHFCLSIFIKPFQDGHFFRFDNY